MLVYILLGKLKRIEARANNNGGSVTSPVPKIYYTCFLSWDKDSCHVDLEKELLALVAQAPEGEEARNGERLIQYATENLVTEVLIHPQTNTLLQCIRNLLASFTKHRHIIHGGYTFGGNGSWILQVRVR
ncbi:hypothetical protein E2986_12776 [Frieseomelitta varia]|uniref:Microtubule-associated protein 1B/S N-terminal domain-containing protein n=1 Tax=Frieseomelitta varia TaxID=561572 RepID=A0A833RXQ8_9HYME|nr:hypothetical protein E2986_12776 [Frieseomelitta varia]